MYLGKVPKTPRGGGGAHKMGGGQMIFPKNGGSVDAMDHFWGECSSKVIFFGGVEINLVDFFCPSKSQLVRGRDSCIKGGMGQWRQYFLV